MTTQGEHSTAMGTEARRIIEETSLLTGRRGEKLCDEAITICDRGDPGEANFDAEGIRRKPVTFIDAGMGGQPVTDLITAARLSDFRGSTGHAPAVNEEEPEGPITAHLRLLPGEQSEAELIESVDRGLYITRFHYVNGLLDTRKATTTGMTRDGTFLIEKGKLGRGVRNMRFTEHLLEAFSRHGGIGNELEDVPTWWTEGGTISVPAILLREFHFTGNSR